MITVLNMELELLKEEMKTAKAIKTYSPVFIKNRFKKNYDQQQMEMRRNNFLLHVYSISKTMPVKIGNLIINYKFLSAFLKKLKGYMVNLEIKETSVLLTYQKGKSTGEIILQDLSYYFEGFQHIPVAVINDGPEA